MTLSEYIDMCGGGRGMMALLTDFMVERDVDVMLALTMAAPPAKLSRGPAKPDTRGVITLSRAGSRAAFWAGALLREALEECPDNLPEALAERVNFANQRIATEGFGIKFEPVPGGYMHVSAAKAASQPLYPKQTSALHFHHRFHPKDLSQITTLPSRRSRASSSARQCALR